MPSPQPEIAVTPRPPLNPQTVGLISPKKGELIDYGRLLGARAGPIGWILALVSGLLLLPLALAFAVRQCTKGACLPGRARTGYVPVLTGTTGGTQTDTGIFIGNFIFSDKQFFQYVGNRATRDLQLIDQRGDNFAASSGGMETTRIEQTRGE